MGELLSVWLCGLVTGYLLRCGQLWRRQRMQRDALRAFFAYERREMHR